MLIFSTYSLGQLLRQNGIRASGIQAPGVDTEDRFETLIDANDQLAERIVSRIICSILTTKKFQLLSNIIK